MLSLIQKPLDWIKKRWAEFEEWVHGWFPGLKTMLTTLGGMVAEGASLMYSFIQSAPPTKYLSQEALQGTAFVLFALAFWFNKMGDRVESRVTE